jgi:hypothetical protein
MNKNNKDEIRWKSLIEGVIDVNDKYPLVL